MNIQSSKKGVALPFPVLKVLLRKLQKATFSSPPSKINFRFQENEMVIDLVNFTKEENGVKENLRVGWDGEGPIFGFVFHNGRVFQKYSVDLQRQFLDQIRLGGDSFTYEFQNATYKVDLSEMKQTNTSTGFSRNISVFVLLEDLANCTMIPDQSVLKTSKDIEEDFEVVRKNYFRWSWKNDDGGYTGYTNNVSSLIERAFVRYQAGEGKEIVNLGDITRLVDDRVASYELDFKQMVQINKGTKYARKVQRRRIPMKTLNNVVWMWKDDQKWNQFDQTIQAEIEEKYLNYVEKDESGFYETSIPGRPEKYRLNFSEWEQKNLTTGKVREISRCIPKDDDEDEKPLKILIELPPGKNDKFLADTNFGLLSEKLRFYTIRAAGSNAAKEKLPILDTSNASTEGGHLILEVKGVAKTIAGPLLGVIRSDIYEKYGIPVTKLSSVGDSQQDFFTQNQKLIELSSSNRPPIGNTRDSAMIYICHCILWDAKASIYGGFLRDFVINSVSANDIDVLLRNESGDLQREDVKKTLVDILNVKGMNLVKEGKKGKAYVLEFSGSWKGKNIQVDLVSPKLSVSYPPGVDSDVGNLILTAVGNLNCKIQNLCTVEQCVTHCKMKQFEFFYDTNDETIEEMVSRRLEKYFKRNWECVTRLNDRYVTKFPQYKHLMTKNS